MKRKVVICSPFLTKPHPQFIAALEASVPPLEEAGFDHGFVSEIGNVYISNAMNICLRRALNVQPDMIVLIDYDMSWTPSSLLKLIQTEGDVVGGTYRYKQDEVEYMGRLWPSDTGLPITRPDGCVRMATLPSGFLKLTRAAINKFMKAYPALVYGETSYPYVDLFNHGAIDGVWFGQDYAFCKRWNDLDEQVWCVPDLDITHHHKDTEGVEYSFPGNYHRYLCAQPGGSHDPARLQAIETLKQSGLEIGDLMKRIETTQGLDV